MKNLKMSNQIVSKLTGYVNCLTKNSYKPTRNLFKDVFYGMLISKNVMVSEITRPLVGGSNVGFRTFHKRLCRGISNRRWSQTVVQQNYLNQVSTYINNRVIIAVDIGDITKPRARKMPKMTTVLDGSTGNLKKGWWLMEVEAISKKGKHIPLWLELFSTKIKKFKSFRYHTQKVIQSLAKHIGNKGLWLFDRGFDNWQFFQFLHDLNLHFLVRINVKRNILIPEDKKQHSLSKIVKNITLSEKMIWVNKKHPRLIECGCCEIIIPQSNQKLTLIVAKGFGRHPLLLLTNYFQSAAFLVRQYLKRWGVEESSRLLKQVFHLENIRVLTFHGLVKLVWLTFWCFGFFTYLEIVAKKIFKYLSSSFPSFNPLPSFIYYRFANAASLLLIRTQLFKLGPPVPI